MRKRLFCFICFICVICTALTLSLSVFAESPSLLKDLDVTNGYMMQFGNDRYRYTVELNEGETVANIMAIPKNEKCSVVIMGNEKKVSLGNPQQVLVSVSDTEGNFLTYILDVYAYGEKGGLNFLDCKNGIIYPQYRDAIRNYYITLPYDCDFADLEMRTWDNNAEIIIEGNEKLEAGKRKKAVLTVKEESGTETQYALYIYRQNQVQSNIDLEYLLSNIEINNDKVNIDFERTRGYYKIEVPYGIDKIDVKTFAENGRNVISITGDTQVTDENNNIMVITVSDPDDSEMRQSVYVLDFVRDSFIHTKKYTGLQMLTFGIVSSIVFFLIILFFAWLYKKKRKNKTDNGFDSVLRDDKKPEIEPETEDIILKG